MEGNSSFTEVLLYISIILALMFFIGARVISRFKKRAQGDTAGRDLSNLQFEVNVKEERPERAQLKCPALIDKSKGVMKVGIKELTTNGAFVTCPNPFPIGESFPIKILLRDRDPQTFNAEVVWNNQNVIEEEVVSRGMKVRFLMLSENNRKTINEIISRHFETKPML